MTKRLFDIVCSLIGLIVMSPVFLILAVLIVLDSKGGVFFRGIRAGQNGKPFRIFKFRSMCKDAEGKGNWNVGDNDTRITKIGSFLRKTKLDETAQLINVFIGDMSFVGPRPELPHYVDMYTEEEKKILKMKPGITDWASIANFDQYISFTNAENSDVAYLQQIRPLKLKLQLYYSEKNSFFVDLKVIVLTVCTVLFRKRCLPKDVQNIVNEHSTYQELDRYDAAKF